jgi:hypothetical protein
VRKVSDQRCVFSIRVNQRIAEILVDNQQQQSATNDDHAFAVWLALFHG